MKRDHALLAVGALLFVALACNFRRTNEKGSDSTSNSVIKEIYMARDDGKGDLGDGSNAFSPTDRTIYCVVRLTEGKSGTKMTFSWWVVNAEGTQNEKIKDIEITTKGLENVVHARLTLPENWPSGEYKVDVHINGNLERTIGFTVA